MAVNVNFASQQFLDPSLVDQLLAMTTEAGITPGRIVIEITESTAMSDFPRAVDVLRRARDAGFRIVLDDCGTGYSSLSCLHELPISGIKLERTFVTSGRRHPMVLDAMVTLAQATEGPVRLLWRAQVTLVPSRPFVDAGRL